MVRRSESSSWIDYSWTGAIEKTRSQLSNETTLIYISLESVASQHVLGQIQFGAVNGRTNESCHVIFPVPPSHKREPSADDYYLNFVRMNKDSGNNSQFQLLLSKCNKSAATSSKMDAWKKIIHFMRRNVLPDEKFTLVFYSMSEMISFMRAMNADKPEVRFNWRMSDHVRYIACVTSKAEFLPLLDLLKSKPVKNNSMMLAAMNLKKLLLDSTIVPRLTCFQMMNYTKNTFKIKWLDPGVYYLFSCHGIRSSDGSRHQSSKLQLDLQLFQTHPSDWRRDPESMFTYGYALTSERLSMNGTNSGRKRNNECNTSTQQPKKRKLNSNPNFEELGIRRQVPVRKEAKEHQNAAALALTHQQRLDMFMAKYAFTMSETESMMKEVLNENRMKHNNDNENIEKGTAANKIPSVKEMIEKEFDADKTPHGKKLKEKETNTDMNPNGKEMTEKETIADNIISDLILQIFANTETDMNPNDNEIGDVNDKKTLEKETISSMGMNQALQNYARMYRKQRENIVVEKIKRMRSKTAMETKREHLMGDFGCDNQIFGRPKPSASSIVEKLKSDDTSSHNQDDHDTATQFDDAQEQEVDLMIELKTEKLKLLNELELLLKKKRQFNAARAKE